MYEDYVLKAINVRVLEDGIPTRFPCPVCGGGVLKEDCMTVYSSDDGASIFATCHRATCDLGTTLVKKGYAPPKKSDKEVVPETPTIDKRDYGWYSAEQADDDTIPVKAYISDDILATYVRVIHEYGGGMELIIRIKDRMFRDQGVVLRRYNSKKHPKAMTYRNKHHNGMAYFLSVMPSIQKATVIIVEDPISAMALASAGIDAVSLNGTGLGHDRLRDITRAYNKLILCLDADATKQAIRCVIKYRGMADIGMRRLIVDIKDMDNISLDDWLFDTIGMEKPDG